MTTLQKILCGMGIFAILYMFATTTTGDCKTFVKVKYNDRLVEYACKDKKEFDNLHLLSINDILFFDGEYFFDEPPTNRTNSRVRIVKWENRVVNGDMTEGELWGGVFLIALCTLIICGIVNPSDGDDYYY